MEHCHLCYDSLSSLFPSRMQTICNDSQLQEIVSTCNKYLSKDICPNTNWSLPFYQSPFCEECSNNTQQLVQMDIKLEQVQSEIKQLTARITEKILNVRQSYQLLIPQTSKIPSPDDVSLPNNGREQLEDVVVTTKPVGNTFENWDLPSSNDSVYDSLQDDTLPGSNIVDGISGGVNLNTFNPNKIVKSSRKQKDFKSDLNETFTASKSSTKVTSSDLQLRSDSGGFVCPNCNKKFTRLDILRRHDCKSQTYECETCGKSFSSQGSLAIHNRIHTGEKPHKCETCGKSFTLPHHLRLHVLTHTGEKPFQCDVCMKCFREKNYLMKHKVQHSKDENERRKYTCEICSKSFTLYQTLTQHLQAVHSFDARYVCKICEKSCGTSHRLRIHELTHSGEKNYKCSQCWKTFSRITCLKDHEAIHGGGKDFQCDACGASYFTKSRLNMHIRRKHVNEGDFICDVCGRMYKTQAEMNQHRKLHDRRDKKKLLGPPPKHFKCVVCERAYTREDHLIKHQKVAHVVTTINSIVCEDCGNDFEDNKEYHNHKVSHPTTQDWFRYKCDICNEIFKTRCERISHFTKKHTEADFPFKCICGSAFLGRKNLYRHKRNVCTAKPIVVKKKKKKNVRGKKSKRTIQPNDDSDDYESKVETKPDLSSSDRRRSGRVRKTNIRVTKDDPSEESDNSSSCKACANSDSEEEQAVQIKSENDIWVKEEPEESE